MINIPLDFSINDIDDSEPVKQEIVYSKKTLETWKIRFDKKYKKDHSLEDIERMVKIGIDFTRTDKEITTEDPMHFGKTEKLF
ncbi:MAG: hypothetical protein ACREAK_11570 [Nitrosarchaeum sp.]